MEDKKLLIEKIEQLKSELVTFEEALAKEEAPLHNDPRYVALCEESEKTNNELNQAPTPKGPVFATIGIVLSILVAIVGLFTFFFVSLVGIVALIVFSIISVKSKNKQQKEIDIIYAPTREKFKEITRKINEMRDQYPKINEFNELISLTKSTLSNCEERLAKIRQEERILKDVIGTSDPYIYKNHIFIHVGRKTENIKGAGIIKHEIFIDGQSYGSAPIPFTKFEMNPGVHTLVIKYIWGDSLYVLNPVQFRVEEKSLMIAFKFSGGRFEIKQYDNFTDFFDFLKTYDN